MIVYSSPDFPGESPHLRICHHIHRVMFAIHRFWGWGCGHLLEGQCSTHHTECSASRLMEMLLGSLAGGTWLREWGLGGGQGRITAGTFELQFSVERHTPDLPDSSDVSAGGCCLSSVSQMRTPPRGGFLEGVKIWAGFWRESRGSAAGRRGVSERGPVGCQGQGGESLVWMVPGSWGRGRWAWSFANQTFYPDILI